MNSIDVASRSTTTKKLSYLSWFKWPESVDHASAIVARIVCVVDHMIDDAGVVLRQR